jgi:hypothetical protein
MKTFYLSFATLLLLSIGAKAQLTLTKVANEPVVGDSRTMVDYDSTNTVPKSTGIGKSWNFSTFASANWTETTTYTNVASVPGSSLYSGATIANIRGGNDYEFYKSNGNNWEFMGDNNPPNNYLVTLSNTAVFYNWPVAFGATNSDIASGLQVDNGNTLTLTGIVSYTAAGTGTVTLPGGVVHNNCLQVIQTVSVTMGTGTATSVMTQITYVYFSGNKKFPIAEIQYSQQSSLAGIFKDFNATFDVSGVPVSINEQAGNNDNLLLFPVPARNDLLIKLPGSLIPETVSIYDLNGRLVMQTENTNSIDVSNLAASCYLIKIKSANELYCRMLPVIKN